MIQDRTWLLIGKKMANQASAEELGELENILRTDPELHFSLQVIEEIWQQTPSHNIADLDAAYLQHLTRMENLGIETPGKAPLPVRARRKNFVPLLVSSVAILLVAYFVIVSSSSPAAAPTAAHVANTAPSEISTRYGSKTNIVLPDGTKVWLNAGSKLTYDKSFGELTRNVVLTGEAYFDVTHNAEMPFVIHTHDMDIKVLGTEFNVKSYPEDHRTETSLIRGSIEVTIPNRSADKIILKPNEKLVVTEEEPAPPRSARVHMKPAVTEPLISVSHLNYFSKDSTVMETSWVENRLVFEDESFEALAVRLSRWYGVEFRFANASAKNLRFTGNFKNESLQDALEAMKITANFSYIITDKAITITE